MLRLHCCCGLCLVAAGGGHSLLAVLGLLVTGASHCRALFLERGLQQSWCTGVAALGQVDIPDQGSNPWTCIVSWILNHWSTREVLSQEPKVQQECANQYKEGETEGSWFERGLRGHEAMWRLLMRKQKLWWRQTGQERGEDKSGWPPDLDGRRAQGFSSSWKLPHLLAVRTHFPGKPPIFPRTETLLSVSGFLTRVRAFSFLPVFFQL